eukprot:CAMPEP_0168502800 /NCGR_PEP_ID=MMETSP0228-20121227/75521_1 /TAXON_ID=133427 /ORGANISM="Protoceratium reticulatum, Strain CCCM 535 (=CCMP 1889)" /LENGTH=217 /DNA_ID=CAMNT_0008519825 /DNA_START=71 /DNA_END=721 /DNA_ORIENTATION=-
MACRPPGGLVFSARHGGGAPSAEELVALYNDGYWVSDPGRKRVPLAREDDGSSEFGAEFGGAGVAQLEHEELSAMPGPAYQWVLRNGLMRAFDRDSFCRLLGGKDILLVGDSLTAQMWGVLQDLLLDETGGQVDVCGGHSKILYVRNDWLDTRLEGYGPWNPNTSQNYCDLLVTEEYTRELNHSFSNAYCNPWATGDLIANARVVVVNAGIHVVPPD